MRYCYRGMWTCQLILEVCHLKWRWLLFIQNMNSVLFAFTKNPMLLAACSRRCSRDSTREGVFARNAWSCVKIVSVLVFLRYHSLLAFFFSVKPSSFIRCIDVQTFQARLIINKYVVNVSSYDNVKEQTIALVFYQSIIIAVTVSSGKPYANSSYSIFSLCLKANALGESMMI